MTTRPLLRVINATNKYHQAREERDQALRDAVKAGESLRVIAGAAGLSHERVRQITLGI